MTVAETGFSILIAYSNHLGALKIQRSKTISIGVSRFRAVALVDF